jgi:hypothetical protein
LPDDVSSQLDAAAGDNASAFVAEALREKLDRARFLDQLHDLWGPLTDADAHVRAWARRSLGLPAAEQAS